MIVTTDQPTSVVSPQSRDPQEYATALDSDAVVGLISDGSGSVGVLGALGILIRGVLSSDIPPMGGDKLPPAVQERLEELSHLGDDWSEEGSPISDKAVATARALLRRSILPVPRIFPTEEGGVRLEWITDQSDVSAEICDDGALYLHYLDRHTYMDFEASEDSVEKAYAQLLRWME